MITIVGAGIFGTTAALSLRRRGQRVRLIDSGPLPRPNDLAASVDSSRAVRSEYGDDLFYVDLAKQAMEHWREDWNQRWGETLFEEAGMLLASSQSLEGESFESHCYRSVCERGEQVERMDSSTLVRKFPQWSAETWVDGYFNPAAGFARAERTLRLLLDDAVAAGVEMHGSCSMAQLISSGDQIIGIRSTDAREFHGDAVLLASGAWSPELLPELEPVLRASAQTLVYFKPDDPSPFAADRFPFWAWDIARLGWYGFPASEDGLVKVGHHGPGRALPLDQREADPNIEPALRTFLRATLPALAKAPAAATKVCLYTDSIDGDFWIGPVPGRAGLFVATGGSGHGFKFAPLLGDLIANSVEGVSDPRLERFAWRKPDPGAREQARAGLPGGR
ncbi:MAG: FAD-dependent oxidoreductase [Planctomycetota bacterium]|jgi:glycine/D-amino acid oxidase-like deaminating enzyme